MNVLDVFRGAPLLPCRPLPRHLLSPDDWRAAGASAELALVALWADASDVHALFHHMAEDAWLPASLPVRQGRFPALSLQHPGAAWQERSVRDLWGHAADPQVDGRPWLDHGVWGVRRPLSGAPVRVPARAAQPELLPAAEGLTQLPLGPVLPGLTDPAHLRLTVDGEQVAGLELRLGYAHKGILGLMRGKSPRAAARFAARVAGDATVAHASAFARAAEAACGTDAPPRAVALRAVMAELERVACHLDDLCRTMNEAGAAWLPARLARHREAVRAAAGAAFGNRLMMDAVVPGGLALAPTPAGLQGIDAALGAVEADLPLLLGAFRADDGLLDRLRGVGVTRSAAVAALRPGGVVGRAAGARRDARVAPGIPPYDRMGLAMAHAEGGDAWARLDVRWQEIAAAVGLARTLLVALPEGPHAVGLPMASGEGIGWAEGARGDAWHWLRLEGGLIGAAHVHDPGWLHLPLLEQATSGLAAADVAVCLASFGLSAAALDL